MAPLLEVRDLHAEFPGETATGEPQVARVLNGVGFSVEKGEVFGLVGESGAGKSLTMRAILGLLRAPGRVTRREALFAGRDLLTVDERALSRIRGREISIIVQNPKVSLDPLTRVGDQMARLAMRHRGASRTEGRAQSIELLRAVGIADPERRARSWPHELSGGMAQRVMIGMALVNAPKLLIADEPTTGLDLTIQKQVLDLVAETVRSRGLTCVLISHDLGVIAAYCSRVAVMFAGTVVETGPVESVFGHPVHPYTRQLLEAAAEDLRHDHPLGRHPPPDLYALPAGCAYSDRCPQAVARCGEPVPMYALAGGHGFACHVEAARYGP